MKSKRFSHMLFLLTFAVTTLLMFSSCLQENKSDQEKLAEALKERFIYIDQFSFGDREKSLQEAEAVLYCWASGEYVSEEDLQNAIYEVLESTDLIRELIYGIDKIDLE